VANWDDVTQELRAGLTNLVAVLGVAVLGWSASALLVVYWVEAGVALVRGILQGPFARREPADVSPEQQRVRDRYTPLASWEDKRGGVSIGPLPPVYPRNMSAVLSSVLVTLIFWPIAGALVIATVGAKFPVETVLLAIVGVVAGHSVGLINYFRNGKYVENTVGSAMSRRYTIGVLVLAVGGVSVLSTASPPSVLFLIVALGKLFADLAIARSEASNDPRTEWDEETLAEQIPTAAPTAVFEANRRNLLLRAAGMAPFVMLIPPYLFVGIAAVFAGLVGGPVAGVAVFAIGAVVATLSFVVRTDVERGHLEYHVYPDRIVAHDRLFDEPQWSLARTTVEEVTVESSRLDRVRPGSRTVVVSTYGDDRRLRALRRPKAFVGTVDSGSDSTVYSSD